MYHSGYERDPDGAEGPYRQHPGSPADRGPRGLLHPRSPAARAPRGERDELEGVDRLVASCAAAGIGAGGNVYAELGSTWYLVARRPDEAAHVLGKLLVALGPERIVWGTDSTWYGSPQPLIDAFRAFTIPESFQERYGYPPLTDAMKDMILGANATTVYGIDAAVLEAAAGDARRTWVPEAAAELHRRIESLNL